MGTRSRFVAFACAGLVLGVGLGFAAARVGVGRLESRASALESRNRTLERTLDAWPDRVRHARAPLEARIRELQQELLAARVAGEALPPAAGAPAASPPARRAAAAAPVAAARRAASAAPVAAASPSPRAAEPAPRLPAVSTSPPRSAGPADCSILIGPRFALEPGEPGVERFGGKLRLALTQDAGARTLHVAGDELSPYPIDALPAHVAFSCDGLPYVISLCAEAGGTVEGEVSSAAAFDEACGHAQGDPR